MKTSKAITLVMMALALSATPALAQRGGGSRGGGGSHSSSMSSSRSSGGSHSSMSSSRSSSSSSRSSSIGSSSRSSSSSYSSPSRSSSSSRSSVGTTSRSSSPSSSVRGSSAVRSGDESGRHVGVRGREAGRTGGTVRGEGARRASESRMSPSGRPASAPAPANATTATGRPHSNHIAGSDYARPGRPGGVMPPSHRPIHPAPYFYHPWHHHMVHCHPIFWDPLPPRPWYWPGFWLYCNSYWYDYHVTDVAVVQRYVQDTYHVDMVTYGISGDIMYAIVRDGGETYLQVYDKDDHLLAEQKINRKYCNMVIDADNGGCWISKKHDKDPLLFIWAEGQLLIYEAD